jgi:nicotinate-nucleotide adenylyltransferase
LRELKSERPGIELFLLIGGDQARALPTWREAGEVAKCATICIAERQDSARLEVVESSKFLVPGQFVRLQMPLSHINATDIRRCAGANADVSPLVGDAVARYIAQHHLYSTST